MQEFIKVREHGNEGMGKGSWFHPRKVEERADRDRRFLAHQVKYIINTTRLEPPKMHLFRQELLDTVLGTVVLAPSPRLSALSPRR
jgi:hypothetical protein